ncbi:hypothetical protein SUGI_0374860 [Cryptomeria japonica]|nr:hypothetical protein SUGI_0374860 [Cryptomeria japonica]
MKVGNMNGPAADKSYHNTEICDETSTSMFESEEEEIAKAHPTINGINYDLPHVIATATHFPGVKHVGGDMFREVPSADAVFIKWVLHDWGDEDCVKILKQCRKAIPESGKRSEEEGKNLLMEVGFPRFNFIAIPALQ